ncbi:hypothetical protein D3C84_760470 [compost metagenome]
MLLAGNFVLAQLQIVGVTVSRFRRFPAAIAAAEDGVQIVGQHQASGQVTGLLAGVVAGATQAGDGVGEFGDAAHVLPVGYVFVVLRAGAIDGVWAFVAAFGFAIPEHHFVLTPEQ